MDKAFLFDMDGVLIDSEPVSIRTAIDYFATKGLRLVPSDFEGHLGAGEEAFFRGPAAAKGWDVDLAEASACFRDHYGSMLARIRIPGTAAKVVRHLRGLGFKTALCSSAPRWKVDLNIQAIGLEERDFDLILSGADVERNKSDGDIYRKAAGGLGLCSADCIVVEDSLNGIAAGLDAGMRVLAVASSHDVATLARAGATWTVSDVGYLLNKDGDVIMDMFNEGRGRRERYGANWIRIPDDLEKTPVDDMLEAAKATRLKAYTPYSHFKVGACVRSAATGRAYTGCNVENSSYGATVCAERNAILHAIAEEGVIGIDCLVVVSDDAPPAPPCALCLQVLAEFTSPDALVILASVDGKRVETSFKELLPNPFIFPSQRT